jgi:hypothetical protein
VNFKCAQPEASVEGTFSVSLPLPEARTVAGRSLRVAATLALASKPGTETTALEPGITIGEPASVVQRESGCRAGLAKAAAPCCTEIALRTWM